MYTDGELSAYLKSIDLLLDNQLDQLKIELPQQELTIGRGESNAVALAVRTVSGQHARITCENSQWFIQDLNSKNGIVLNEILIDSVSELNEGDVVSIGGVEFDFGLNKPEILLRQDTIIMHTTYQHPVDFSAQYQESDKTMHFSNANLTSELKIDKAQAFKRKVLDLFKFKKKYLFLVLLIVSIIIAFVSFDVSIEDLSSLFK